MSDFGDFQKRFIEGKSKVKITSKKSGRTRTYVSGNKAREIPNDTETATQTVQTSQAPPKHLTEQPTVRTIKTPIDSSPSQERTRFGKKVDPSEPQRLREQLERIEERKQRFQESKGVKRIRDTSERLTPRFLKGEAKEVTTNVIEGFLGFPIQYGAVAGEAIEKGAVLTQAFVKTGFDKPQIKKEGVRAAREVRDIFTEIKPSGRRGLTVEGKTAIATAAIGGLVPGASRPLNTKGSSLMKSKSARKVPRARGKRGRQERSRNRPPLVIVKQKNTRLRVGGKTFKVIEGKSNTFVSEVTQKSTPRKVSKPSQPPFRIEQSKTTSIVSSSGRQVSKVKNRFSQGRSTKQVTTQLTIERTFQKKPLARRNVQRQDFNKDFFKDSAKRKDIPFKKRSISKKPSSQSTELVTRDFTLQSERYVNTLVKKSFEKQKSPIVQSKSQATKPKPPVKRVVAREETIPRVSENRFSGMFKKEKVKPPLVEVVTEKPSIDIRSDTSIKPRNIVIKENIYGDVRERSIGGKSSLDLGRGFVPRQARERTVTPILSVATSQGQAQGQAQAQDQSQGQDLVNKNIFEERGGNSNKPKPKPPVDQTPLSPIIPPTQTINKPPTPRRNIFTTRPPRRTTKTKVPILFSLPSFSLKKRTSNVFTTQVVKKGKFVSVGRSESKAGAFSLGSRFVGGSAHRSFRVLKGGTPISLGATKKFRRSKSRSFTVVEKSRFAINTPGEIFEIGGASKRRRKRI